ncbi:unnamed protein product [Schistocephalus solidus]|uniref:dCMP deaminase n=1 Tax=Schistocephalus solidus TaxID=70667 RepID=A0A3P7D885_SCHSO|nr:unnamed protein product [Schistocephalus solidus]
MNDFSTASNVKRTDYLSWDEYFMSLAFLSAMRSKDPITQVGVCIINSEKKIVAVGYNGMPVGLSDDEMPWTKGLDDPLQNKHLYVCHAELNAVLNKNSADVKNCTLYSTLFPCNECAKVIIQCGIKEVVYFSDAKINKPQYNAAKIMFAKAGVKTTYVLSLITCVNLCHLPFYEIFSSVYHMAPSSMSSVTCSIRKRLSALILSLSPFNKTGRTVAIYLS